MTATKTGILIGAVLALSWVAFGFWSFDFVAVAMAVGALVGRIMDGRLDVNNLLDAVRGKRSSPFALILSRPPQNRADELGSLPAR